MTVPASDQFHFRSARAELAVGLDRLSNSLVGRYHRRKTILNKFSRQAETIFALSRHYTSLDDYHIQESLARLRGHFLKLDVSDEILNEAIALLAALSFHVLKLLPHKVQIIGILGLHRGYTLEMDTGEGKTLVAGLAGILMAWHGRPAHVLTVNDYLARRDCNFIQPLLLRLELSAGVVISTLSWQERQRQYACDVVYTTSHELLADFLRDRIQLGGSKNSRHHQLSKLQKGDHKLVSRGIHSVIIDEIDSILIDQAVSPLIIAAPSENPLLEKSVSIAHQLSKALIKHRHYQIDDRNRQIQMNSAGLKVIADSCQTLPRMWQSHSRSLELVEQALMAREFYLRNTHYIVENQKVIIVDEFSGRKMPERSWSLGLHQAVEAKEGVPLTAPNEVQERMSYQNFFRLFSRISGLSGTVREAADELWQIYGLPVLRVPRNTPCQRTSLGTKLFAKKRGKWQYLHKLTHKCQSTGQPVLIGTRTIQDSEQIARIFNDAGLPFQLLNANHSEEEAEIISRAGQCGAVTIATNMAGRGTDIKLNKAAKEVGGLFVIVTELHSSTRVDRQLIGRSARQGDLGMFMTLVSYEDEIICNGFSETELKWLKWLKWLPDYPFVSFFTQFLFSLAQKKREKEASKQRQIVLDSDTKLKGSLSFSAK